MPKGPNWKPLKQLHKEVRILRNVYFKHTSYMTRAECNKFLAYFGPVISGSIPKEQVDMPGPDGKVIECESSESEEYEVTDEKTLRVVP